MTFEKASKCFRENSRLLEGGDRDPIMWNLSVGLYNLTEALRKNQIRNENLMNQILSEVRSLPRR